MAKTWNYT